MPITVCNDSVAANFIMLQRPHFVGCSPNLHNLILQMNIVPRERSMLEFISSSREAQAPYTSKKCIGLKMNHPNIVHMVGYDRTDSSKLGYASIFMQHCELGSVAGIMKQYAKRHETLADEAFLWKVFWDTSLSLCSL
ncbi:hypothetical protein CC86DRAFT_468861 [Ophiobolus disseminans]|uniref:Protein kinase domain-containing protein n=1 Tax=Ophiobolus disseminans TaxID=1469910 RepID=A0A6A6ZSV7_9PLEO|nr:hypothetical protein CC86DRAFT_468861 [Ophiobolus disseminans]